MKHLPFTGLILVLLFSGSASAQEVRALGVCADPNHVPFLDRQGNGFENKIIEVIARSLKLDLRYHWVAYQTGTSTLKNSMAARSCNVILGLVRPPDRTTILTRPYYRSSYVIAYLKDRDLRLSSLEDLPKSDLKIAVHSGTPPQYLLERMGAKNLIASYYPFPTTVPPGTPVTIMEDLLGGKIDVAVVWGPVAGYYAAKRGALLEIVPVYRAAQEDVSLTYDVRMGIDSINAGLKTLLDQAIEQNQDAIRKILQEYGVPIVNGETPG